MERIKVKPAKDRVVIHPISRQPIAVEGEIVEKCFQIMRYLKFKDLEIVVETKSTKKSTLITGE